MEYCVVCGIQIEDEVTWAVLGDEEFRASLRGQNRQTPFPLHRDCFEQNRVLTVQQWVTDPGTGDSTLEDFETVRYVEIEWADGQPHGDYTEVER